MTSARDRRGSFLLFSVALVAVMVAFGYALLQTIRLSADAGASSQRQWFAQEAAIAGLHHAMENIALDYRSSHCPATYLDGIWHRDFYPIGFDQNQPDSAASGADDDVRSEHALWQPLLEQNDYSYWEYGDGYGSMSSHLYQAAGRARFYEVGYSDPADPTYAVASRPGSRSARFTDTAAPVPARAEALFLDAQLKRIVPASGESVDAVRKRARYRLRYAVMTNDAGSAMLINPELDADYRDVWPPGTPAVTAAVAGGIYADAHYNDYGAVFAPTEAGRRLERYGNSLVNMLAAGVSHGDRSNVMRLEHVFKLRGAATNVAIDQRGWPVAFPTMIRDWTRAAYQSGAWKSSINWHANSAPMMTGMGLFPNSLGVVRLEGGQSLGQPREEGKVLSHALVGPQFSYRDIQTTVTAAITDHDYPQVMGHPVQTRGLMTPFGRAGEKGVKGGPAQWNRGPTDVPWVIDPLTASSGMVWSMINGYMPAAFRGMFVRYEVDGVPTAPATQVAGSNRMDGDYVQKFFASYGRDLFTDFMSPAFKRWPARQGQPQERRNNGSPYLVPPYADIPVSDHPVLWPNYNGYDDRSVAKVYPGPYASLSVSAPADAMEDTGRYIDASEVYCAEDGGYGHVLAYDSHSHRLLAPGTPTKTYSGQREVPMHGQLPIGQSFFWDMSAAFSTAISVMRLHWVEVKNPWVDPATVFPNGRAPSTDMDSIEDLDRLFLKQLGIDFDHPDADTVIPSWKPLTKRVDFPRRFGKDQVILAYNIRTLAYPASLPGKNPGDPPIPVASKLATASLTSAKRARAMEMMLNDWRMSFLGASPDYAADFRPLDFDGDKQVICSAYRASYTYPDDAAVSWPCQPVVAEGRGPAVDQTTDHPFSLTGCFTMTKSRYYRVIVRGELWDSQLRRPVSNATMESVLCIDPNGMSTMSQLNHDVAVLSQRWMWNSYNGMLPTIYP